MIGQSSAPLSYLAFSGNWCSIMRQKYDDEPFLHFCLFPCTCVCVYLYSKMVECCHSHMPLTYSNYNLHQPFDWSSVRVYNN